MSVYSAEKLDASASAAWKSQLSWPRFRFLVEKRLAKWITQDLAQWSMWAPVAIGVGVGAYFGLKAEPFWLIGPVLLSASLAAALFSDRLRKTAQIALLCALGFVAADLRTHHVSAPILDRDLGIRKIEGRLITVENLADRKRFVLALTFIEGVRAEARPERVRVTWRGDGFEARPGDAVQLRAGLGLPPPPATPGGFDFGRRLYFQRIGGVGFAVTPPVVTATASKTWFAAFKSRVERMRAVLFARITKVAPGEGGAIVAAVVTGKRDAITPAAQTALRDAGLAHLLAISGLHMGLATGLIFFSVRGALVLIEPVALKYPVKKWAAFAALLSGFAYLILSGGGWSARRAFMMAAIIFTAILLDRRALSLRNVAIAAVIILLMTPEALFHPGFQISFAAVTALIAAYEWFTRRADPFRSFSFIAKFRRYTVGLMVTDTIAALATAPYALYHFNRVALYSLPANVLSMPLMGFWVMPMAVIALLLTPLGLDGWAWSLSAAGMEIILKIAKSVSSWPGAVSLTPQWPLGAMLSLTLGGLWLCLARSPLRLAGVIAIPVAAIMTYGASAPDMFVAASGRNAGVIVGDGDPQLAVYTRRRDRFAMSVWQEAVGLDPLSAKTQLMKEAGRCDRKGCALEVRSGVTTAFIEDRSVLAEDCARADLVVAFFPVSADDWRACGAILIDRRSVWRRGAHAVWLRNGDIEIKTVSEWRGRRPWTGSL